MKRFWIVMAVLLVMIGGGFGFCWHAVTSYEDHVAVEGGVLVWQVAGEYAEERDDSFRGQLMGGGETTFSETLFALLRAADDARITGLLLDMRGLEADWAKVDELRGAVARFRDGGKPVVAYIEAAGLQDYALAAGADDVVLAPEGTLMVLGLAAEMSFMKDTLAKLGMKADFVHVGAYKSAPEQMTRSSASEANREMVEAIVGDRYETLLAGLAADRGVDRDRAAAWIDRGLYDAPSALAAGLVDTVLYYDEMIDAYFPSDETTDLGDYQLERRSRRAADTVAMIHVSGVIMPGESRFDPWQGKIAGDVTVCEQLDQAREDDDVAAVILRVDSPGGSALAADLMWDRIRALQDVKPVIVSMSGLAASGGYYVSCLGDSVFADAATLTGSIGVYAGKLDRSGMYGKIGVNREYVTRGRNALMMRDAGEFTPDQRALFQEQMDVFYERFLAKVSDGRGLSRDEAHAVAQGRVWTGRQGLEHGLVDGIGGLERALTAAKHMIGLTADDKVSVITYGEELSLLERMLLQSLKDGSMSRIGLGGLAAVWAGRHALPAPLEAAGVPSELLTNLRRDGTLAAAALLDGHPVAMTPYMLRVR
jgi:protease-4